MSGFRSAILSLVTATALACAINSADAQEKLRFAVGPLQPTPSDTKKAFEPFFKYIADKLGRPYELVATTDWAGVSIALSSKQADVAWMGPWGYVLAYHAGGGQAVATVKYDGKPVYYAIIIARPELKIDKWPDDAKGLRMSFADVGSTSGWLIPTFWFQSNGIDPKQYFQYREGATHAANEISVSSGQTDLATDFNRNRDAMIERGAIKADSNKIVWTSPALPNDALVVREDFDPQLAKKIQEIVAEITEEQAKSLLPKHYTGWVKASHADYKMIEDAGIAVGKIKPKK